jgi:hypothetical protein
VVGFLAPIPNWLGALILITFAFGAVALSGRKRDEAPFEEGNPYDTEESAQQSVEP